MSKKGFSLVEIIVVIAIILILMALMIPAFLAMSGKAEKKQDADQKQAIETSQRLAEADRQIGMPDITRFTERKLAKDILELRDKEIATYCYIVNMHGDLIFIGEAVGYGLPYSVQYTNPEKVEIKEWDGYGSSVGGVYGTLPQADPNGLFMPGGLSATWIMLRGPDGNIHPVYMEPEIIVSPFPLHKQKGEVQGEFIKE